MRKVREIRKGDMTKSLSLRSWEERVRRPTRANPSCTKRAGISTGQHKILTDSV
jgi:hypothetical protein